MLVSSRLVRAAVLVVVVVVVVMVVVLVVVGLVWAAIVVVVVVNVGRALVVVVMVRVVVVVVVVGSSSSVLSPVRLRRRPVIVVGLRWPIGRRWRRRRHLSRRTDGGAYSPRVPLTAPLLVLGCIPGSVVVVGHR